MADDDQKHKAITGPDRKSDIFNSQSHALMLYRGDKFLKPASIQWLGPHIDLKIPPQNWMRARSPVEKYVERTLTMGRLRSHMSSISMATANIDQVDLADVISDAKNIRSLLTSAFETDRPISLMVHRVGKTLLIDDFDIHKHLLRRQKDDWKWLRSFYEQQIKQYPRVSRNQRQLVERNIFSKFLYYSILSSSEAGGGEEEKGIVSNIERVGPQPRPHSTESQATQDEEIGSDEFFRTLQWNFEDIKMMIGTDIPIFNVGSSLVSLRLREASSAINVLTGLGYWLDNLMCNVPEIAMCYHQGGFVQKYERISTSEIPSLEGAEFEPAYVKDMAQNILSFLKANATKFGHTYWLYKEKNGDIIKLYDLTSLCDTEEEVKQDPFRLPLANLLFRVALKLYEQKIPRKSSLIRALLSSCLALLHNEHPEMTVSAVLILSDIYLKDDLSSDDDVDASDNGLDTVDNDFDNESSVSDTSSLPNEPLTGLSTDTGSNKACSELNLTSPPQNPSSANSAANDTAPSFPPLPDDQETRCEMGLTHIAQGLVVLDADIEAQQVADDNREPERANSSIPIPLPYTPLINTQTLKEEEEEEMRMNTSSAGRSPSVELIQQCRNRFPSNSWHGPSKSKLLSKAMYALFRLAANHDHTMKYGQALKCIKLTLLCFEALFNIEPSKACSRWELGSLALRLAGDSQLKLAKMDDVTPYRESLECLNDDEVAIMKSALKEIVTKQYDQLSTIYKRMEDRLLSACQSYELSHKFVELLQGEQRSQRGGESDKIGDMLRTIQQRLGNCYNELSRFYMDRATHLYQSADTVDEKLRSDIYRLLAASEPYLDKGMAHFESVSDRSNMALLTSNSARLLRLKAGFLIDKTDRGELSVEERRLYNQAADRYLQALNMLPRTLTLTGSVIKENIRSDLSGVYYTVASLLQDFTPPSSRFQQKDLNYAMKWRRLLSRVSRFIEGTRDVTRQIGRDITDLMLKALKYCDSNSNDTTKRDRAANIHHRLASLFHSAYREASEQKKRQHRQMTENHYTKAIELYHNLENHTVLLRLLLEKVALYEFDFNATSAKYAKVKHLESGLSVLLGSEAQFCVNSFCSGNNPTTATDQESEVIKLLTIFSSRLQFCLLNMLKLVRLGSGSRSGSAASRSSSSDSQNERYKLMYKEALSASPSGEINSTELCKQMLPVLHRLRQLHLLNTAAT